MAANDPLHASEGVVPVRHPRAADPQQDGWINTAVAGSFFPQWSASFSQQANSFATPARRPPNKNIVFYPEALAPNWTSFIPAVVPPIAPWDAAFVQEASGFRSDDKLVKQRPGVMRPLASEQNETSFIKAVIPPIIAEEDVWLFELNSFRPAATPHIKESVLRPDNAFERNEVSFTPVISPQIAIRDWMQQTAVTAKGPKYQRDTNPDIGWLFKNIVAVYDPSKNYWFQMEVDRNFVNQSLSQDAAVRPQGGGGVGPPPPAFDPSTNIWSIDSGLPPAQKKATLLHESDQGRGAASILNAAVVLDAYSQLLNSVSMATGKRLNPSRLYDFDNAWEFQDIPVQPNIPVEATTSQYDSFRAKPRANRLDGRPFYDTLPWDFATLPPITAAVASPGLGQLANSFRPNAFHSGPTAAVQARQWYDDQGWLGVNVPPSLTRNLFSTNPCWSRSSS